MGQFSVKIPRLKGQFSAALNSFSPKRTKRFYPSPAENGPAALRSSRSFPARLDDTIHTVFLHESEE